MATWNVGLDRKGPGLLVQDLDRGEDPQIAAIVRQQVSRFDLVAFGQVRDDILVDAVGGAVRQVDLDRVVAIAASECVAAFAPH